jgi:hypothetical protein
LVEVEKALAAAGMQDHDAHRQARARLSERETREAGSPGEDGPRTFMLKMET